MTRATTDRHDANNDGSKPKIVEVAQGSGFYVKPKSAYDKDVDDASQEEQIASVALANDPANTALKQKYDAAAAKLKAAKLARDNADFKSQQPQELDAVKETINRIIPAPADMDSLFGLEDVYFRDAKGTEPNKLYFFQIKETGDIFEAARSATTYLRLKEAQELNLGDSVSRTVTTGIKHGLDLMVDNPAKNLKNLSVSGIATELTLKTARLSDEDLYPYSDGDPLKTVNEVNVADIDKLKLAYGNITSTDREAVAKLEFLSDGVGAASPESCDYLNLTYVTQQAMNACPDKLVFNVREFDGRSLLPSASQPSQAPLSIGRFDSMDIPASVKLDPGFATSAAGVNIVEYKKGKGRLAFEEMDGISRSTTYAADQYTDIFCKGAKFSVTGVPFHSLEYYAGVLANVTVSAVTSSVTANAIDTSLTTRALKATTEINACEVRTGFTPLKICQSDGAVELAKAAAMKVEAKTLEVISKALGVEDTKLSIGSLAMALETVGVMLKKSDVDLERSSIKIGGSDVALYQSMLNLYV